jgi:hypothetical protein
MSILTAGVTVAVSAMHRADAEKEANIIASVLEMGRIQALSQSKDSYVLLYANEDGQYITFVQNGEAGTVTPLDNDAQIAYRPYHPGGSAEEVLLEPDTEVKIYFSKSSGAFKAPLVDYIKVTADKDLYVCLVKDTGRCYIDTTY